MTETERLAAEFAQLLSMVREPDEIAPLRASWHADPLGSLRLRKRAF